jgi:c-di-GMP-binding flagellar brake protein YcgR
MSGNDVLGLQQGATPPFELELMDGYSQYLLHTKPEILAVLRSIIQKGAMTTVHFDDGESFFLTSILSLSPDSLEFVFDASNAEETNERAIKARKFTFTTFIDKVRIQFTTVGLKSVKEGGRPAFSAVVPDKLLRLQRREFFRLSAPIANPIRLRTVIRSTDRGAWKLEAQLLDISGGGVGLIVTPSEAQWLQEGETLHDCKMMLPDEGLLTVTLHLRNKFDVTSRSGLRHVRIGCEFVDLPSVRLNAVQRYITRIERERKARLNGLV